MKMKCNLKKTTKKKKNQLFEKLSFISHKTNIFIKYLTYICYQNTIERIITKKMTKYILLNRRKSKIEKAMISLWIGCENVIFNCGKTMKNLRKPILTENQHSKNLYKL